MDFCDLFTHIRQDSFWQCHTLCVNVRLNLSNIVFVWNTHGRACLISTPVLMWGLFNVWHICTVLPLSVFGKCGQIWSQFSALFLRCSRGPTGVMCNQQAQHDPLTVILYVSWIKGSNLSFYPDESGLKFLFIIETLLVAKLVNCLMFCLVGWVVDRLKSGYMDSKPRLS